jgi:hypothetical protein
MLDSEGDLDRVHLAMKVQDRAPYWFWILLWLEVHFEALLLGLCPTVLGVPPVNNTYENPDVRDGRHPQRFFHQALSAAPGAVSSAGHRQ